MFRTTIRPTANAATSVSRTTAPTPTPAVTPSLTTRRVSMTLAAPAPRKPLSVVEEMRLAALKSLATAVVEEVVEVDLPQVRPSPFGTLAKTGMGLAQKRIEERAPRTRAIFPPVRRHVATPLKLRPMRPQVARHAK